MKENLSQDTIKKMSIAKKGKKRSRQSIEKQVEKISKKVVCVETNIMYSSTKNAAALTGVDGSCIAKVCRGERKTAGGFHWHYADNYINEQLDMVGAA